MENHIQIRQDRSLLLDKLNGLEIALCVRKFMFSNRELMYGGIFNV